jgi:hypothetical protein
MKRVFTWVFLPLLSATAWGQPATPDDTYKQPFPHSSGADLLPYCEETDRVVSQLRCDYYIQGVADLATIPQNGRPLACIPQGQSRTQLMQIAVGHLQTVNAAMLENASAATLILDAFRTNFPCPKNLGVKPEKNAATGSPMAELLKICAKEGDKEAIKKCVDAGAKK